MDAQSVQTNMQPNGRINLIVHPTTGGTFQLSVSLFETVVGLKRTLARRLTFRADRMSLLHRDRLLIHGNLFENQLTEGSSITLVPNMETGTTTAKTDSRVMQALETLTETQVNDFLTGRAPLLLAMRFGEHMMFVQLQLSTSSCAARRRMLHPTNCGHVASASHLEKSRCPCSPAPQTGLGPTANPGASIDSINHLGHGVYSGTFSGTLDPTVQETSGKPKRDINTILQILNDLLVASPQFRQNGPIFPTQDSPTQNPLDLGQARTNGTASEQADMDNTLRGKVQSLQRKLHERRIRRQEKRGLRAPYQWSPKKAKVSEPMCSSSRINYESSLSCERELGSKSEPLSAAESTTFSTPSSNLEQEGVLV